jgi:hypothetical protein
MCASPEAADADLNISVIGLADNRDPIAGNNDPLKAPGGMLIPERDTTLRTAALPRFVTTRGGVYLFMPGIAAIRYLAGGG